MNRSILKIINLSLLIFATSFLISACSSTALINSSWNDGEIKIDGNTSEWQNGAYFVDEEGVTLNFKNDDEFLYLCLITNNHSKITQIMRSGFIVWFDSDYESSKKIGLKYPMQVSMLNREERQEFNKEIFRVGDMQNHFKKIIEAAKEFQILNEEKFPLGQMSIENNEGIKVKLGFDSERLVYELQIPIESSKQYQNKIAARPGDIVTIDFETLEYEFDMIPSGRMMPRNDNENMAKGERPGNGMRRGEERKFEKPEPFNLKVELQLQKHN
jgi:hypothetical protein